MKELINILLVRASHHDDSVNVNVKGFVMDFMKKLIIHIPDEQFKMIK